MGLFSTHNDTQLEHEPDLQYELDLEYEPADRTLVRTILTQSINQLRVA